MNFSDVLKLFQDAASFLNSFPVSRLRYIGVIYTMMGLMSFFVSFSPSQKRNMEQTPIAKALKLAKDNPVIQLDKPIDEIFAEYLSAMKTYMLSIGVPVFILGIAALAGLFSGLVMFLIFFIICVLGVLLYTVIAVRYGRYQKEIYEQYKSFQANKKGL